MKQPAIVIGTGGHCRVVLSLLAACGTHEVIGIVELNQARRDERIMGFSDIYPVDWLDEQGGATADVFLAIGNNSSRATWYEQVRRAGWNLPNLISPEALIDPTARLGDANVVCARAFVGPEAVLSNNNLVNTGAIVEHEVRIGSHCHLAPSSTVAGRSHISDNVFVGAGATVIDRICIAPNITIGAAAVVVDTIIEADGVYVGVPARRIGDRTGS